MEPTVQKGYLVLADISGYTSFMAESELDHAQGVLSNILKLVIRHLTPALTLAEVEGDAVFVYAPQSCLSRGELLLELIESTYVAFRDRQKTMQRNATCRCKACQAIPTLDLKFVAHYGDYVLQNVAGRSKPIGSCVNLVHRLLKNSVPETTGWRGYALFTEESLRKMDVQPEGMHREVEGYEHLGEISTCSVNLAARYQELTAGRRVFLGSDEADVTFTHVFSASPAVLWDWLNDPSKRTQWMKRSDWAAKERPRGRTEPGAQNHCATSRFIEHILDWRPFDYFTVRYRRGLLNMVMTGKLEAVREGTRLQWNMKLDGSMPRWMLSPACKFVALQLMKMEQCFETIEQLTGTIEEWDVAEPGSTRSLGGSEKPLQAEGEGAG